MGSDGLPPHLWPGSALYGAYRGLSPRTVSHMTDAINADPPVPIVG
jgi:hypothetical protein